MNINDSSIDQLLEKLKPEKRIKNSKGVMVHKLKFYELPELSFEKCEHKRSYAACIVCQARDLDTHTDHKLAREFYPRFAQLIRCGPGSDEDQNTPEIILKHFEEIWKCFPKIIWEKKATYFDTMIYYNDHLVDEMPDNSWFRKWLYLSSMYYDVKEMTGLSIPKLTDQELSDIEYSRSHLFTNQIRRFRDAIKYERWYNF